LEIAPAVEQPAEASVADVPPASGRRPTTAHLKLVPATRTLRDLIRARCVEAAAALDKSHPLTKDELTLLVRRLLHDLGQPEGYLGWTMVALASEFWRDQVAAVPPARRLFLLPHCLQQETGCPAEYSQYGLDCGSCRACAIADYRAAAEALGYRVLVAEGSPLVMKIIVSGCVDAIAGVACLNVLEKAFDKILLAGIPCMAVPLLSSDCHHTAVDGDWVYDMIRVRQERPAQHTRTYLHLMRGASQLFEPAELQRLAPPTRAAQPLTQTARPGLDTLDPVAGTEALAYDFLRKGGKHSRPFITLAVYDALTGGHGTLPGGADHVAHLSDAVKCVALSIEMFHKASLIHDDIEDDDWYRYGDATLHRKYGTPTAINVGDYMIGLGYRLVSREVERLGAAVVADLLHQLAEAHTRLCEGQGAELLWRGARQKRLSPLDALRIYALKTAPAFEAAFLTGVRLAGPVDGYIRPVRDFARNLGVAFQILNDLHDWQGDQHNKLTAGSDTLAGRPTVLLALALESLPPAAQDELMALIDDVAQPAWLRIARVRQLYEQAGAFDKADRLVDKHQQRARAIAEGVQPDALRRLLLYVIETVLERPAESAIETPWEDRSIALPVTAAPAIP
jgi:geranylgeranyl pyrophosphate synthase